MAIKIVRETENYKIDAIKLCLYGQPGVGKTSAAFTADSPILFDFDAGAYRASFRRDIVQIKNWEDIASISESDLSEYKTVIIDTVGRALDVLIQYILRTMPKMKKMGSDDLSIQGYGALKTEFQAFVNKMLSYKKDIIFIAHSTEVKKGEELLERLQITGGAKDIIYNLCDVMGKIHIQNKKRIIEFDPTETSFGKNPANLGSVEVPSSDKNTMLLSSLISNIKDKLEERNKGTPIDPSTIPEVTKVIYESLLNTCKEHGKLGEFGFSSEWAKVEQKQRHEIVRYYPKHMEEFRKECQKHAEANKSTAEVSGMAPVETVSQDGQRDTDSHEVKQVGNNKKPG